MSYQSESMKEKEMKKVINMINPSSKVSGVSLLEFKKTERALGAFFPDEYKELFLETNGAKFGDGPCSLFTLMNAQN